MKSKKIVIIALVFILAFIVLVGIAFSIIGNDRHKFKPGEEVHHREVILILDATASIDKRSFETIKDKVVNDFLPKLGIGDEVSAYFIDSDFSEPSNKIFVGKGLSKIPGNITQENINRFDEKLKQELIGKWESFQSQTPQWKDTIRNLILTKPHSDHSDYFKALLFAGDALSNSNAKEKWMIVFGDLINDTESNIFPDLRDDQKRLFKSVNIRLVYPFGIHKSYDEESEIKELWSSFFDARGAKVEDKEKFDFLSLKSFNNSFPKANVPDFNTLKESLGR